jgi:sulfur-oxidizing protein SoxZ
VPDPIKIRASLKGELLELRVLLTHPMESGQRRAPDGTTLPAHYIQNAQIRLNGALILEADLGTAVAKNPLFAFKVRGAKAGDTLSVAWVDNQGQKRMDETRVIDGART